MDSQNLTLPSSCDTIPLALQNGLAPDQEAEITGSLRGVEPEATGDLPPPGGPRNRVMSPENRRALEYLQVRGYYTTTYTQIVQPERIFAVTDYFRRYWVPLLKPGPAWLVVALRQRCFWNGQSDWCVVSRERLAEESGVAVRTADGYLDLPLVGWFVTGRRPRYSRTKEGAKRRDWTHYDLRLDEPLTPAHQAGLAALAAEVAAGCAPGAGLAAEIARRLLDLEAGELVRRIDLTTKYLSENCHPESSKGLSWSAEMLRFAQHDNFRIGSKYTKETKVGLCTVQEIVAAERGGRGLAPDTGGPCTVQEIVEAAAAARGGGRGERGESDPALVKACDALYARIVRPDKVQIATQYFRLRWLPQLGAARAWLILHLRARCYLSTQDLELRDRCSVGGLGELAAALGVSVSTVKSCLAGPQAAAFVTHLATHRPGEGRVEMRFQVEMIDPLAPADQQPEFAGSPPEQEPEFAGSSPDQKTESAPLEGQRPDFAGSSGEQEPESAGIGEGGKGQDLHDTKTLTITPGSTSTQQPQVLIPAGKEAETVAAAAGPLQEVLAALGIQEPARSRILVLDPPAARVLGWACEAWSLERIDNKPGFVASMLLSGYAPPAEMEALAGLTVAEWRALALAARAARSTGRTSLPAGLAGHFEALYARYGRLDPTRWPVLLPGLEEAEAGGEEAGPEEAEEPPAGDLAEAEELWQEALAELRGAMDPSTFNAWLKGSRVARAEGRRWTVAVRNETAAGWLAHRLRPAVERVVARLAGEAVEVGFEAGDGTQMNADGR